MRWAMALVGLACAGLVLLLAVVAPRERSARGVAPPAAGFESRDGPALEAPPVRVLVDVAPAEAAAVPAAPEPTEAEEAPGSPLEPFELEAEPPPVWDEQPARRTEVEVYDPATDPSRCLEDG